MKKEARLKEEKQRKEDEEDIKNLMKGPQTVDDADNSPTNPKNWPSFVWVLFICLLKLHDLVCGQFSETGH